VATSALGGVADGDRHRPTLLIPEVWELTKSTTFLKVGALLVNIAIVLYLLWRMEVTPRSMFGGRSEQQPSTEP
jgi:hypothetical protein